MRCVCARGHCCLPWPGCTRRHPGPKQPKRGCRGPSWARKVPLGIEMTNPWARRRLKLCRVASGIRVEHTASHSAICRSVADGRVIAFCQFGPFWILRPPPGKLPFDEVLASSARGRSNRQKLPTNKPTNQNHTATNHSPIVAQSLASGTKSRLFLLFLNPPPHTHTPKYSTARTPSRNGRFGPQKDKTRSGGGTSLPSAHWGPQGTYHRQMGR